MEILFLFDIYNSKYDDINIIWMEVNRNILNVVKGLDLVNEVRLFFWYLINYDIIIDLWIIFFFFNGLKGIM